MKVYGVPLSPFVRKVRLALAEKGVDYELDPILPMPPHNQTAEFKRMSPLGKVPALADGDFLISDSSVILQYLDRKHPDPKLVPDGAEECARALWFEELADTKLIECIGPVFFNRRVRRAVMNEEPDQAAIDAALEALPPYFDYLEEQIGEREFLVGDGYTVADLALGSMLRQFEIAGESVDESRWPRLAEYWTRLSARPAFQTLIESENATMRSLAS